jgi:hypothetical protein
MVHKLSFEVIKKARIIDIGERRVSRVVKEFKGRSRFVIYLPITRNDVWEILWERKIPVKVFLEIPEGAIKEDEENREGDQR